MADKIILTEEQKSIILAALKEDPPVTWRVLTGRAGLKEHVMRGFLARQGLSKPKHPSAGGRPYPMPPKEDLIEAFEVHRTDAAVAEHFGVGQRMIARWRVQIERPRTQAWARSDFSGGSLLLPLLTEEETRSAYKGRKYEDEPRACRSEGRWRGIGG